MHRHLPHHAGHAGRQAWALACMLAGALLMLSACGSSGGSPGASNGASTGASSPPTAPTTGQGTGGGSRWRVVASYPEGGQAIDVFEAISCADALHCQAFGGSAHVNYMLGTSDGGVTWTREAVPAFLKGAAGAPGGGANDGIPGLSCPTVTDCYAITQRNWQVNTPSGGSGGTGAATIGTHDGGRTWTWQATLDYTDFAEAISCPTASTCYIVGDGTQSGGTDAGFVAATKDSGLHWRLLPAPAAIPDLHGISCATATHCVATGASMDTGASVVLVTSDGGATWTRGRLPRNVNSLQVDACPSSAVCFALASPGAPSSSNNMSGNEWVASTDGGLTWRAGHVFANGDEPLSMSCASTTACVVAGDTQGPNGLAAMVRETRDAGRSWRSDTLPGGPTSLKRVSCATPVACYAIGGTDATPSMVGTYVKGFILSRTAS